jgi:hypothetical protein
MNTESPTNGTEQMDLLDFGTALAARAEPARLREVVRGIISNKELWAQLLPHFVDTGVAGSLQFDRAVAAHKVRAWDGKHGGLLDVFPGLNEHTLALVIGREMRRAYSMKGGRIVGMLPAPEPKVAP